MGTSVPTLTHKRLWIALAAITGVVLAAGTYGLRTNAVPAVVGMSQPDAEAALHSAGLRMGEIDYDEDVTGADLGTVIRISPDVGARAWRGTTVAVVIAGPRMYEFPDLQGMPEADAISRITEAGFIKPAVERIAHSDVAAGRVLAQAPAAGTSWARSWDCTLTVSTGPEYTDVPVFKGLSEADCRAVALEAGVVLVSAGDYSMTIERGVCSDQSPAPGTAVIKKAEVFVTFSKGPNMLTVKTPSVWSQLAAELGQDSTGVGRSAQVWVPSRMPEGFSIVDQRHFEGELAECTWRCGSSEIIVWCGLTLEEIDSRDGTIAWGDARGSLHSMNYGGAESWEATFDRPSSDLFRCVVVGRGVSRAVVEAVCESMVRVD